MTSTASLAERIEDLPSDTAAEFMKRLTLVDQDFKYSYFKMRGCKVTFRKLREPEDIIVWENFDPEEMFTVLEDFTKLLEPTDEQDVFRVKGTRVHIKRETKRNGIDPDAAYSNLDLLRQMPGNKTITKTIEDLEEYLRKNDVQEPTWLRPVNFQSLLAGGPPKEEWLAEGLWPKKSAISIVADGKAGKSLLMFYVCGQLAMGLDPWTNEEQEPLRVGYFDQEQTDYDLLDRTYQFGFTEKHPRFKLFCQNMQYYLLQSLPPLDTVEGGRTLLRALKQVEIDVIVLDTFGRLLEGDEDHAGTVNAYFRNTAQQLKQNRIDSVRLDHTGHHNKQRARGTSGKNQDIDVAWSLVRDKNTVFLDHHGIIRRRVPQKLTLELTTDKPAKYQVVNEEKVHKLDLPPKIQELLDKMIELKMDLNWGRDRFKKEYPDVKFTDEHFSPAKQQYVQIMKDDL